MRRLRVMVYVVLASLILTGCATQRHLDKGDEALENGDMARAVRHYEHALDRRHALADDDDFIAKLSFAQSRVAFDQARSFDREGLYESAIGKLIVALDKDPSYNDATLLLSEVRHRAARWRYRKAIIAADGALLDQARDDLERALVHDADLEEAHWAMMSLSPQTLPENTAGLAAFREGAALSGGRRWSQAQDSYREAITLNPNLLPARSGLFVAGKKQLESVEFASGGDARIRERRIGPAIVLFERSLEVWPFNEHAQEVLVYARAELVKAVEQYALATASAEALAWDDAIAQVAAGLAIDRSHQPLRALRPALPRRAAADYTARGDRDLAAVQLDNARTNYLAALRFVSSYRPANRGLSSVYAVWAEQFEQAGRPGAALLHYRKAHRYDGTSELSDAVNRVTASLYAALDMGLAIDVARAPRGSEVSETRVNSSLLGIAQRRAPAGLTIAPEQPAYIMEVTINASSITRRLIDTDSRTYTYSEREQRHNSHYDNVARRLASSRNELSRLERHYHAHRPADTHHGHHHPDNSHENHLDHQIERQRRRVHSLERELSRTPHYVYVNVRRSYRYQVEHHAVNGGLTIASRLIETATGNVIEAYISQVDTGYRDETITNPRPDLGLRADELHLPSDREVAGELASKAASDAITHALDAIVGYKLDRLRAQAAVHREAGEADATLELEVAGGLLIRMVDPEASANVLNRLSETNLR